MIFLANKLKFNNKNIFGFITFFERNVSKMFINNLIFIKQIKIKILCLRYN